MMRKEKKTVESDLSDEENSPSILPVNKNNNNNPLLKSDDLNSSDIVLPTQNQGGGNVDYDNDDDNESEDSFQSELNVKLFMFK